MLTYGAVALVTGANRCLGRHFVEQLRDRGAKKVYATARRPAGVDGLTLDITDPDQVTAAADAHDVTLLVNNAGISTAAKAAEWSLTNGVRVRGRIARSATA